MAAEVKPHVDAWGGQAKDAFYEAKRRWDGQMDGMILLLNQAGLQVDTSNAEYISTDAKSAQGFNIRPHARSPVASDQVHEGRQHRCRSSRALRTPARRRRHRNEGTPMIDFTAVLDKILEAANLQGYSLDPADITRAAKDLDEAQTFLAQHGLQGHTDAPGKFGSSDLGSAMSYQHERVYGIMSRALDTVAKDLGAFSDSILSAAKKAEETDADAGVFLTLTQKVESSGLHNHHGGRSTIPRATLRSTPGRLGRNLEEAMSGNEEARLRSLVAGADWQPLSDELDHWSNAADRLEKVADSLLKVAAPVADNLGKQTVDAALKAFTEVGNKVNGHAQDIQDIHDALHTAIYALKPAQHLNTKLAGNPMGDPPTFPPDAVNDDDTIDKGKLNQYQTAKKSYDSAAADRETQSKEKADAMEHAYHEAIAVLKKVPDDQTPKVAGPGGTGGATPGGGVPAGTGGTPRRPGRPQLHAAHPLRPAWPAPPAARADAAARPALRAAAHPSSRLRTRPTSRRPTTPTSRATHRANPASRATGAASTPTRVVTARTTRPAAATRPAAGCPHLRWPWVAQCHGRGRSGRCRSARWLRRRRPRRRHGGRRGRRTSGRHPRRHRTWRRLDRGSLGGRGGIAGAGAGSTTGRSASGRSAGRAAGSRGAAGARGAGAGAGAGGAGGRGKGKQERSSRRPSSCSTRTPTGSTTRARAPE